LKRTFFVSLCEFFNVIVQFANFILWGFYFGARAEMDAFLTSLALPMVLVTVITGPLVSSLVPLLVEARGKNVVSDFKRFKNNLINLFAVGGLLLALLIFSFSGLLVRLIAPGLSPEMRLMAAQLLRIEVFSIPLLIVGGVLTSFFYAEEKFYRPTIAPFFGGLAAILLLVFWHQRLGIHALAWGMVFSALVQMLFMLGVIRDHSWRLNWHDAGLRKLARKMLPLSGGSIYYKSDSLIDRFILSFLPAGSISYLGYGQRVITVISQVLSRGLVTTRFTELSAKNLNDQAGFKESLNRLFGQVCFVIAPIAVCLILFVGPVLHFVFQRGAFSAKDVQRTTVVIIAFLGILIGGLLGSVLANAFYALGDTKTITLIGITVFTVGIFLKIAGVLVFSYVGVALAASLYYLLAVVVEIMVLQRKIRVFSWRTTGGHLLKVSAAALAALAAGLIFKRLFPAGILPLAGGIALVSAVYFLLSWLLGVIDKSVLPAFLNNRLKNKQSEN
jgi:putative peptidoglycan lipid II flippase